MEGQRPFSLSTGVVPVLFLIAWRSNHPVTRDWSLRLLKQSNRREGVWDAEVAAHMAERVVRFRDQLGAYGESCAVHLQISEINFDSKTTCRLTYITLGGELSQLPGELVPFEGARGEQRYTEDLIIAPT